MSAVTAPRLRTFLLIWFGQLVSLVGSGLTNFALGVWVYERTGSATELALISVVSILPGIVMSPVAGALVDRYDRRWTMIISDTVAGLSTVAVALLLFSGRLEIWHIYLSAAISSTASAFQYPAYAASTTLLVPKKHLGRAAGMTRVADAISLIIAPALAGVLIGVIGLEGIMLIDFVTFLFAVGTLFIVRFPPVPADTTTAATERRTLRGDVVFGLRYLLDRPGLMGISLFATALNFLFGMCSVLLTPMVLSFATAEGLGTIMSALGGGMLLGSVVMSAWGGPKRRVLGIYLFGVGQALTLMLAGLRPNVLLISVAMFLLALGAPISEGSVNALRQAKIAPNVQGRVFAFSRMLSWCAIPLAYLLAGPLADSVFEPMMQPDGALAGSVGALIGTGAGRGMAVIFLLSGALSLVAALAAMLHPRIRNVERELPDYAGTPAEPLPELAPAIVET